MTHGDQLSLARAASRHVRAAAALLGLSVGRTGRERTTHAALLRVERAATFAESPPAARAAMREASALWWRLALSEVPTATREAHRLRDFPLADMVQEGMVGLYQAARRFDPDRGLRFSTYARWWARAQMTRAIDTAERPVRISSAGTDVLRRARLVARALERAGVEPTTDRLCTELADAPGASLLRAGLAAVAPPKSLDWRGSAEDDETMMDRLALGCTWEPEEELDHAAELAALRAARAALPVRLRTVLDLRLTESAQPGPKTGGWARTLNDVGRTLRVSMERARQLESDAHEALRRAVCRDDAWAAK